MAVVAQLVVSDTRDPQFESIRPVIGSFYLLSTVLESNKINIKWPGLAHLKIFPEALKFLK